MAQEKRGGVECKELRIRANHNCSNACVVIGVFEDGGNVMHAYDIFLVSIDIQHIVVMDHHIVQNRPPFYAIVFEYETWEPITAFYCKCDHKSKYSARKLNEDELIAICDMI